MRDGPIDDALADEREPVYPSLDPARLRLFQDGSGRLRLTIEGDRTVLDAKVVRAFPLSDPDHYIAFLDGKDRVIGTVADPAELDATSRQAADDDLARRYFTPVVRSIRSMKQEFGAVYCEVDTDHGTRQFVAKGFRDAVENLGGGQLLMADVDGNRYRVIDWRRLDARSRRFLERVI